MPIATITKEASLLSEPTTLQPNTLHKFPFGRFVSLLDIDLTNIVVNDYDPIADSYDEIMGEDFHTATYHIRKDVIDILFKNKVLSCLDLCCGTGIFLNQLSKDFVLQGVGIDLSECQLDIAKLRCPSVGQQIDYRQGNIIDELFPEENDVVTINFDALNHISGKECWEHVFRKIHLSLRSGGVFLFDINLPERLTNDWNSPEIIVKENVTYIQVAYPVKKMGGGVARRTPMIVFLNNGRGMFSQKIAIVEQFALPLSIVKGMLKNIGFSKVEIVSPVSHEPIGHIFNKNRAYLVAHK